MITNKPEATRLIDQDGQPYGVKHIDNKIRVSSVPYDFDIVKGNIPNHKHINKFGHNIAVGAALEPIWDASAAYTWSTTSALVAAAAGVNDTGNVRVTGTATGGSTTTIIDTGVDFVALGVVVGDLVVNDTNDVHGIVTNVAVTVLTIGTAVGIATIIGDTYRVINATGTGAAAIKVYGLDGSYDEIEEYIVLNGAAGVNSTKTFLRLYRAKVLLAGANGWNVAAITITGAALIAQITAQMNKTLMALWTVPNGYTAYMTGYYAATTSNKITEVHLYVRPFGEVFQIKHIISINQGLEVHPFDFPVEIYEKSDIMVQASAVGGGGEVSAGFDLWYEL